VARTVLPDPLRRRHLVERELPAAQALRIGEAYLAEGRAIEAVDFLRKAGAAERLTELRRGAVEAGDSFLLRAAAAAAGEAPRHEEWEAVARAAEAAGKLRYAADARQQLNRGGE
jgi:hypothetical protein